MNIYKISCYSKCGSYFLTYLKSVTVISESKEGAIEVVKKWLHKENRLFIEDSPEKWGVDKIYSGIENNVVIDCAIGSDY